MLLCFTLSSKALYVSQWKLRSSNDPQHATEMRSTQPALLASLLLHFCWVVGTPACPSDPTHTLPSHGLAMALDLSAPLICMVDSSPFLKTLIKCLPGRHSCPDHTPLYYDLLYVTSFPSYHFARSKVH